MERTQFGTICVPGGTEDARAPFGAPGDSFGSCKFLVFFVLPGNVLSGNVGAFRCCFTFKVKAITEPRKLLEVMQPGAQQHIHTL